MKTQITTEQLIEDLKRVADICHKIPSDMDYTKHGNFNKSTIHRRFGTWNNALQLAFQKINKVHGPAIKPHQCLGCGALTKNPKFCSMSCAATTNNAITRIEQVCPFDRGVLPLH